MLWCGREVERSESDCRRRPRGVGEIGWEGCLESLAGGTADPSKLCLGLI